jgi:hypothetical protein
MMNVDECAINTKAIKAKSSCVWRSNKYYSREEREESRVEGRQEEDEEGGGGGVVRRRRRCNFFSQVSLAH